MKSSTRVTKGKIVVESSAKLAPDAFPLKDWIPGRRRVPTQERSQRTRRQILSAAEALTKGEGRQILSAAEALTKGEGVGNITMQMIAAKSKIAAGTAYQFFDDRDAIFAEIYEEWAVSFWTTLNKATATPWTDATWRSELRGLITQMGKFYLASSPRWDIIRYVESTKQGRGAMRTLLDANISRFCDWAGPLFRARGYSAAECKAICGLLVRTIRGHWVYGVYTAQELRELSKTAEDGTTAIVEVKLTRASRP
ncbi:MAG: TetR/AcrR family transcriptional regulator, partial [Chloroflexi bacterium]|nr:TetR/AcrR family transcriptional regulator [Chloroflexota bacterium]